LLVQEYPLLYRRTTVTSGVIVLPDPDFMFPVVADPDSALNLVKLQKNENSKGTYILGVGIVFFSGIVTYLMLNVKKFVYEKPKNCIDYFFSKVIIFPDLDPSS
jgi:hypothetical protein